MVEDPGRATRPSTYHAAIPTFVRRPVAELPSLGPGKTAVVDVPYDYTSGSPPGAKTTLRRAAPALFQFLVVRAPACRGR